MHSVYVQIVGLEDILKLLSWLSYPSTLHKDVCGALGMDSVSVEVVGLEELGPELLFTEGTIPLLPWTVYTVTLLTLAWLL